MRKKIAAMMVLILVFCLGGTGCNKREEEYEKKSLKEYYAGNLITQPKETNNICDVFSKNENQYYVITASSAGLIWETKDGGSNWEKLVDKPDELADCYLNEAVFVSEEEIFCTFFKHKNDDEIIAIRYLISLDGTYEKINLEGLGTETDGLSDLKYSGGYLYGRNANGEVNAYDLKNGEKKYTFSSDIYTNMYCIMDEYIVVVGPSGAETYCIENETRSNEFGFVEEQLFSLSCESSSYSVRAEYLDGKLYCITLDGIYEIDSETQKVSTLVYGREQNFGNINVWVYDFTVLENKDIFISMMNSESESEFWNYKYQPEGVERFVSANEISLYSLEYDSILEYEINVYNTKKGNVYVDYKFGTNGMDSVTKADAIKKLNTELMAKEGPDIILMDGLPKDSYIKKGILKDLTPLLTDEYFSNIAKANTESDEIYSIPRYFKLMGIIGDRSIVNEIDNLDKFVNAVKVTYDEDTGNKIFDLYYDSCYVDVLYQTYCKDLVEGGKINEVALESFYHNLKEIRDIAVAQSEDGEVEPNTLVKSDYSYTMVESIDWMSQAVAAGDLSVAIGGITNVNDYAKLMTYSGSDEDIAWELYKSNDKVVFIPTQSFGINTNSKNYEGAKEFLTYILSETAYAENSNLEAGFPINQNAFNNQLSNIQQWQDEFVTEKGENIVLPKISLDKNSEKELTELISNLNTSSDVDAILKEIIMEQAERFVNEEESLGECVRGACEKANIYLME